MTVVLDAEALSLLARTPIRRASHQRITEVLSDALERGEDVLVPAAVLAELYRGGRHDQALDVYLSRFPALMVVDTDKVLAREIGHVLVNAGRGSADHVDASVVAVAVASGGGVVATSDVDDISALAADLRGVRVLGI